MIVHNVGKKPIFIITEWTPDPNGGTAIIDSTLSIAPGEGIDLDMIGLSPDVWLMNQQELFSSTSEGKRLVVMLKSALEKKMAELQQLREEISEGEIVYDAGYGFWTKDFLSISPDYKPRQWGKLIKVEDIK